MKGKTNLLIAALISVLLIFGMAACGSSETETANTGESFTGSLVDAQGDRIVVRGDTETMLFKTADQTVYDFGEGEQLALGDTVQVGYHETNGTFMADDVTVMEHSQQLLVFGGQIGKVTDDSVTVGSGSMTVSFAYDDETKIQGELAEGNIVTVTYDGDLSEDPHAVSVVVTQEKAVVKFKRTTGTISEVTDKSVLISVDSAKSYRFKIDKDTKIYGKAKDLRVGDSVGLVYAGDMGKEPLAKTIEITKLHVDKEYVIDGTITKASKDQITITTGKNTYKFKLDKKTDISKKDPKVGLITTVTYTGELGKDAVAKVIYCSGKEDPKVTAQAEKKDTTKATDKETKAPKKAATKKAATKKKETKASKEATKVTESKATETKATETQETETKASESDVTEDTETDVTGDSQTEEPDPEEPTQATETVTEATEAITEAVTEATEAATEAATEPTKETEPPKETEPKEEIIEADGMIQKWEDKTTKIKITSGSIVELSTKGAEIASGYFPQENDEVRIKYDKVSMTLKDIQLVYREVPDEE